MSFDPNRHMIKTRGGKDYLPVAARLVWFRMEHPDWGIVTEPHTIDMEAKYAIYRATILDANGKVIATATKQETARDFPDFLEKSETGAIGRALAMCGYGTQFAPEFEEVNTDANGMVVGNGGRVVDAPLDARAAAQMGLSAAQQRPAALPASSGNRAGVPVPPSPPVAARAAPAGAEITRVREAVTEENLDPGGDAEDDADPFADDDSDVGAPAAAPVTTSPPSNGNSSVRPASPQPAQRNNVPAPPNAVASSRDGGAMAPSPQQRPIASPSGGGGGGIALTQTRCSVENCPAILTQSQLNLSTTKYGKPLCPLHQRDSRPLPAREPLDDGAPRR